MNMAIERLTECIRRAVQHAQFRNFYRDRFGSHAMRELYARKRNRNYSLPNTDAISLHEGELADLVSELSPKLVPYRLPETGAVCNGFYEQMGLLASPCLPSVEDYARSWFSRLRVSV